MRHARLAFCSEIPAEVDDAPLKVVGSDRDCTVRGISI
jgi:hypothetical protein